MFTCDVLDLIPKLFTVHHFIFCRSFLFLLSQSFSLEFHFEPNSYFKNAVLTKVYRMKSEPDAEEPFSFEGPEIIACEGYVYRSEVWV